MIALFRMVSMSSIATLSLGEIDQCTPAVSAKICCLYGFFVCQTPRLARCSFEGDILGTIIVSQFMGLF